MQKLLIAVHSETLLDVLRSELENEFTIYTCRSGEEALQLLDDIRPEALIIQLSLSKLTGLEVLQRTSFTPPAVLALALILPNWEYNIAAAAGVSRVIMLPSTASYISFRIKELVREKVLP